MSSLVQQVEPNNILSKTSTYLIPDESHPIYFPRALIRPTINLQTPYAVLNLSHHKTFAPILSEHPAKLPLIPSSFIVRFELTSDIADALNDLDALKRMRNCMRRQDVLISVMSRCCILSQTRHALFVLVCAYSRFRHDNFFTTVAWSCA